MFLGALSYCRGDFVAEACGLEAGLVQRCCYVTPLFSRERQGCCGIFDGVKDCRMYRQESILWQYVVSSHFVCPCEDFIPEVLDLCLCVIRPELGRFQEFLVLGWGGV